MRIKRHGLRLGWTIKKEQRSLTSFPKVTACEQESVKGKAAAGFSGTVRGRRHLFLSVVGHRVRGASASLCRDHCTPRSLQGALRPGG